MSYSKGYFNYELERPKWKRQCEEVSLACQIDSVNTQDGLNSWIQSLMKYHKSEDKHDKFEYNCKIPHAVRDSLSKAATNKGRAFPKKSQALAGLARVGRAQNKGRAIKTFDFLLVANANFQFGLVFSAPHLS